MREERKVVTALFADTVGSTAIAERLDPEDAHELIRGAIALAIEAAETYGGTVKDLAGDGALILFGAPVSHEDDAERAVRAGLEIVRSIEIRRRASGPRARWVLDAGRHRDRARRPRTCRRRGKGGVRRNRRRREHRRPGAREAEPGTVLVGPGTYDRVASLFEWGLSLGVDLKGKSGHGRRTRGTAARRQGGLCASARGDDGCPSSVGMTRWHRFLKLPCPGRSGERRQGSAHHGAGGGRQKPPRQ